MALVLPQDMRESDCTGMARRMSELNFDMVLAFSSLVSVLFDKNGKVMSCQLRCMLDSLDKPMGKCFSPKGKREPSRGNCYTKWLLTGELFGCDKVLSL